MRPIRHRRENRVRAHVFLCMLAYYVLWHMMEAWRPLLFSDEDQQCDWPGVTRLLRRSAPRPPCASAQTKKLDDGSRASSFRTLLRLLSNIVRNCRRPEAGRRRAHLRCHDNSGLETAEAYDLLKVITLWTEASTIDSNDLIGSTPDLGFFSQELQVSSRQSFENTYRFRWARRDLPGAHDVTVRRDDAASSVEHRGINRARRVLFARSRFLCTTNPEKLVLRRRKIMRQQRGVYRGRESLR